MNFKDALAYLSPELQAEAEALAALEPKTMGLMDYIPHLSPGYAQPTHLKALVDKLELARTKAVKLVLSVPPRHYKTETLLHSIPWRLEQDAGTSIAYVSYAQRFAERKAAKARALMDRAGIKLVIDAKSEMTTGVEDGGLWVTTIGGASTGMGFDLIIVDDIVANRADAESATMRENTWEWFNDTLYTRLEPGGSIIVCMARWHVDDLAGRLERDGWEVLNLPAINAPDDPNPGQPLCPSRWSLEALEDIRKQLGAYGWSSLYMGNPQEDGLKIFGDLIYGDMPDDAKTKGYQVAIGTDLAYSGKANSDRSVAVVMAQYNNLYYILDVVTRQVKSHIWAEVLKELAGKYPGAPIKFIGSGPEEGTADLMRAMGVNIQFMHYHNDKKQKAQPVAAAWNQRKILVPKGAPWAAEFSHIISSFTGHDDPNDDAVDAMGNAYSCLPAITVPDKPKYGTLDFAKAEADQMFKSAQEKAQRDAYTKNRYSRFGGSPFGSR